jgi:hypothetical protein
MQNAVHHVHAAAAKITTVVALKLQCAKYNQWIVAKLDDAIISRPSHLYLCSHLEVSQRDEYLVSKPPDERHTQPNKVVLLQEFKQVDRHELKADA